ncbi:MAG: hypothetical protein WD295_00110, partial [Bacteroidota bacterium]
MDLDRLSRLIAEAPLSARFLDEAALLPAGSQIFLRGAAGSLLAFLVSSLHERRSGGQTLLIVPDNDSAETLRDDSQVLTGVPVHLFIHHPRRDAALLDMSAPIAQIETLKALSSRESALIVASVEGIVGHLPPPADFTGRSFVLRKGGSFPFEDLLKQLSGIGFDRKDFVEGYGDFAVRGGIL